MTKDAEERPELPRFELRRIVGRSAASVVWEATQTSTGRLVALKILNVDLADEEASRRFNRECRIMGMLSGHPHIVTIYDAGIYTGRPWLAMQFCAQGSFATKIESVGRLPVTEAVDVLVKIGGALAVAHERGVLHCDVKPANIMISEFGEPALGDFGIARVTAGAGTRTGAIGYSLDHAPPELLNEQHPNVSADVYSLGTTIWQLVSGRSPFRASRNTPVASIIRRILLEPLPEPTAPDVPAELTALLKYMTAKEPGDRPASMVEVVEAARDLQSRLASQRSHALSVRSPISKPLPAEAEQISRADSPGRRAQLSTEAAVMDPSTSAPRWKPAEPVADNADPIQVRVRTAGREITQWLSGFAGAAGPSPQISRRRLIISVAAALVIVLVSTITILVATSHNSGEEIVLHGVTEPGPDPFTSDFSVDQELLPDSALASVIPAGLSTVENAPGNTEGLYQGTKGGHSCDRDGMLAYLVERPVLAAAWVNALNTDPTLTWRGGSRLSRGSLPQYFTQLTPVLLRADTRVTEHRYLDNRAQPYQSTLQAGTAVLTDAYGVPRTHCSSGNPLTQLKTGSNPRYDGESWPGFNSAALVTVAAASEEIHQFGLIDAATNSQFRRPAGSTGGEDIDQVIEQSDLEGIYKMSGDRAACAGSNCEQLTTVSVHWRIIECAADKCTIQSLDGKWSEPVDLVRDGTTWRAAGTMSRIASTRCGQNPAKTDFAISFTVATARVIDSTWLSDRLDGTYETIVPAGECPASAASYQISGGRT